MTSFHQRGLRALALALGLLAFAGCRRPVPLTPTTPVLLQHEADPEALRAAIVRALEARQFTTESEEPGRLVARLSHRGRTLRVAIEYGPEQYRITYLESTGLGYRVRPDGQAIISPYYDRYVQRLRRTIDDEIERPAREAREAEERQREHEMALLEQERRREQETRDAEARERERQRQHELERERVRLEAERARTRRARAEAEARRPVIVNHEAVVVGDLELAPRRTRARFGVVRVGPGLGGRWLRGQAEGRVSADRLGLPRACRGYYAGSPEHVLRVRRGVSYLRLETDSQDDPTLVVVASDGSVWCDDDGGEGLNSRIEGTFPAGTYRIFVGSYRPRSSARYRLLVTSERAAARVEAAPSAPAPAPSCRQLVIDAGHGPGATIHCRGAEPRCAAALLRAGHGPGALIHCQGVEPGCAEATLRAGHGPGSLVHCQR
ncbi:MAG TPA: hypothetical protein RMH99_24850 [Sandaracinaceae bacterium LLY-WYZ-13_1]|nr:hypothetical protein [Sandaracinaceae bacterium LLY-WYZ-13_1]